MSEILIWRLTYLKGNPREAERKVLEKKSGAARYKKARLVTERVGGMSGNGDG